MVTDEGQNSGQVGGQVSDHVSKSKNYKEFKTT